MDRSAEGILFVDPENRIRYWNRAAEVLFELGAEEFSSNDAVRCCALPTPDELGFLRSGGAKKILGSVKNERRASAAGYLDRVIESIEIDGQPWLMVRLKSPLLRIPTESELYQQARTDHLSSLMNRRAFQIILEENLHRQLALAIIDVDFFKHINDRHGHEAGDRAIQWLADRLRESFPDAVCIARLGGDEFGVVLDVSDRDRIESRFKELCESVRTDPTSSKPAGISISIGVAIASSPGVSARELLSKSDRAMYQSKNEGRNRSTSVDV